MLNSRTFLLLCSFLLLFLSQIQTTSKPEPSSILYDFTGTCEGKFLCLPYSKITFASIWSNQNNSQIIEQLNAELQNDNDLNKKLVFKESRFIENEIGLFAKESIQKNELLASFSTNRLFSSAIDLSSFSNMPYYTEHSKYPSLKFDTFADNSLRISLNLLYHIYHFEDSTLKLHIQSLPPKPDTPLFTFSIYEAKLIRPDRAFDFFYTIRKKCLDDFERLIERMKEKWTSEQIKSFLNGKDTIPFDDFVYAYYIYITRTITIKKGQSDYFNFIAPFINHAKRLKENNESPRPDNVLVNEEEKTVKFLSNWNYKEDDEIYYEVYEAGSHYQFIIHGIVPSKNPQDCFNLEFFTEEQAKTMGLKTNECVSAGNNELLKYFITCNLANMKSKQATQCQELLLAEKYNPVKMYEIMIAKCKLHKWNKWNFFEEPESDLQEIIQQYDEYVVRVKEYMYMRYKEQKSRKNANLIYQYISERIWAARDTIIKMENLQDLVVEKTKKKKKSEKAKAKIQENQKNDDILENFEEKIVQEFEQKGDFQYKELEDSDESINKKLMEEKENVKIDL